MDVMVESHSDVDVRTATGDVEGCRQVQGGAENESG